MEGESALAAIGDTPLVELETLSPEDGATMYAKWEGANPTGSMKDRMAYAMIRGAESDGTLEPGQHVLEFTGGSTGSSLGLVCAVKGYPLTLLTADCFAEEKIRTMRAMGADLEIFETPHGEVHPGLLDEWRARVEQLQPELGAHFTDQFHNEYHPQGYHPLGREIVDQCPNVTDLVMGVGTGGGAMGTAEGIREDRPDLTVTVVEPAESPALTEGESGSHSIEGVALGIEPPYLESGGYDDALAIPQQRAMEMTRTLAETEGLFAGTSTGLNVAAGLELARTRDPADNVVTVAVDSGLKYLHGDVYS